MWTFNDFQSWYTGVGLRSGTANEAKDGAAGLTRRFAESMRTLAADEKEHVQIREARAIAPLVALLGDANVEPETQSAATAALALLAVNEDSCASILEVEGSPLTAIDGLLKLLRPSPKDNQVRNETAKFAACALGNITSHRLEWSSLVSASGAVAILVNKIQEHGPDAEFVCDAANALGNLAWGSRENREALRKAGGVEALVGLLALGPTSEAALLAARAVANAARDNHRNCAAFVEANAIPLLVNLLAPGLSEDFHLGASTDAQIDGQAYGNMGMLTRCAADACYALASDKPEYAQAFRDAGGVTALVALLKEAEDINVSSEDDPLSATSKLWGLLLDPADMAANISLMVKAHDSFEHERSAEAKVDKVKAKEDRMKKRGAKK